MNTTIIQEFEKLIKQIEYEILLNKDEINIYRLARYKKILQILKNYKTKIKSGKELENIKGVGKKTVERINEIIKNGYLKEIYMKEEDLKKIKLLKKLEEIIGIGKKSALNLIKKNIKSINDLKNKIKNNEIKVNKQIKFGLKYYKKYDTKIYRKEIDEINSYLQKKIGKDLKLIICGSYRRQKDIMNDIDVVITYKEKKYDLFEIIEKLKSKSFFLDAITYKNYKTKYMGFCKYKDYPLRRIDIIYVPYKSYYTALVYFTGSAEFNRNLRLKAKKLGYKLNQYGLYKNNKKFIIKSEKELFEKLNIEYIEPKFRII